MCLLLLEDRITPSTFTVINTDNSGPGSLQEAITLANSSAGNDEINFSLTGSSPFTITMNCPLPIILNANAPITSGTGGTVGTLTIIGLGASSLTISGDDGNSERDFNVFNIESGGVLTISGVTVSGGKIAGPNRGGAFNNFGTLNISNSTLSGNSAVNLDDASGGAISNTGTLTVSNSILSGNSAGINGGGIVNYGTLTISNSTISGNSATSQGGGIFNKNGAVTVLNSTISGNSTTDIRNGGGAGIFNEGGEVTVSNSTLSGNSAMGYGGGIFNEGGAFTVSNSTLSGNSARGSGGGVYNNYGTITVTNSTLSGNSAGSDGGGIYNLGDAVNIVNTIIANSTGGDFYGAAPTINLNNLVEDGSITGGGSISGDPLLGPLQNNGGPTSTLALLPGSAAIGAGNATVSNASPVIGLDQRGFARSSTTPSIGAFEFYNAPTVNSLSPVSGTTAGSTPITITGTNFVAGPTTVTIGGVAATNVVVANSTTITANSPPGTTGNASVLVTTAGGTNAANTLFTYYAPTPLVTGTTGGSSQGSTLNFVDPSTGITNTVVPFPGFMGDVRVAAGDINNDGKMETIAAAGTGGGPAVNLFDSTGKSIGAFFAYDPAFRGGLYISVSDVNNDGFADIVTGAGAGGGPHVKIFNGKNLQEMGSFFAFDEGFTGGVSVASADINGDGTLDIVTGAGPGGGPHVKVFDGKTNSLISQWFAYASDFTGGVFVAIGDIGNDGKFEVVTGAGVGGGPVVAVFNPFTGALQTQFFAYGESFTGGVRVGVSDGNGDGVLDLVTGAGPGGGPHVKGFNYPQLDLLFEFFSGPEDDTGGVFVS